MNNKESYIDQILKDVLTLYCSVLETLNKETFHNFLYMTINGDDTIDYIAVNANLSKGEQGIVVYIFTNVRLIKIDIGKPNKIQSSIFILDYIINMERELLDDDIIQLKVSFKTSSFGLRYPTSYTKPSDFFSHYIAQEQKGYKWLNTNNSSMKLKKI